MNKFLKKMLETWIPAFAGMTVMICFSAISVKAEHAGDQGYGIMLGKPSGFSGKIWLDDRLAFDGAFGVEDGEIDAHLSLLIHDEKIPQRLQLTHPDWHTYFYFGAGPRVLFEDNTEFGIRVPAGFSFFRKETDWEIFTELAPIMRLTPDVGFDADFAIGARFYFRAIRAKG